MQLTWLFCLQRCFQRHHLTPEDFEAYAKTCAILPHNRTTCVTFIIGLTVTLMTLTSTDKRYKIQVTVPWRYLFFFFFPLPGSTWLPTLRAFKYLKKCLNILPTKTYTVGPCNNVFLSKIRANIANRQTHWIVYSHEKSSKVILLFKKMWKNKIIFAILTLVPHQDCISKPEFTMKFFLLFLFLSLKITAWGSFTTRRYLEL